MNETAVIVLSVVCIVIVIGIVWFLIRNHKKESNLSEASEGSLKEFGGVKTTFEDPRTIWTTQTNLPEIIDVVSDLSLIGINSFLGNDSWESRQMKIDKKRLLDFIDFSFEFSKLILTNNLDAYISQIRLIVKSTLVMQEELADRIIDDPISNNLSIKQIYDLIVVNFGRMWLDVKKLGAFKTGIEEQINYYVSSKLIYPEEFKVFQRELKYENLVPKAEQDPLERKRFDGINLICSFFLKNLWTSHIITDEPKYIDVIEIITKTLRTGNDQELTERTMRKTITNALKAIGKALESSKIYAQTISPELVVSMAEAFVLLQVRERTEIFNIEYVGSGTFNTCFKITLSKPSSNRRVITTKSFALKLLKESTERENLFRQRKFDKIFREFISYPQPILSNYEYYNLPVNSDTDPPNFNRVEYDMKFQCDWRIYKLYSSNFSTSLYRNPRMQTLKPNKITRYEFIVSKEYKDQILSEEAEKIRFKNICKYINQMALILFKLHSVGSVYYDWKIGNIALDEKFNFILIDNDFVEITRSTRPTSIPITHNIKSVTDRVLPSGQISKYVFRYDPKTHFDIDSIILLKELYSVFNATDKLTYNNFLGEDIFEKDDLRIEFSAMLEKIDYSEFPYLYNLINWYLEECPLIKQKNPFAFKRFPRHEIEIVPDREGKPEKFNDIFNRY